MKELFLPSLKKKLVLLISVGYVVPVFLLVTMLRTFITDQYDQQFLDKAQLSLVETTELASNYLSSMIEAIRRPSYEGEFEQTYRRFLETNDRDVLYTWTESNLVRSYRYNSLILSVALFYQDPELEAVFLINEGAKLQKAVPLIYQELYPRVQLIAQDIGNAIYFYENNNRLYMIRNLVDSSYQSYGILMLEVNVGRMYGAFQGITGVTQVNISFNDATIATKVTEPTAGQVLDLRHSLIVEGHEMAVTLLVDIDQGQEVLEDFQNEITQILILLVPAIGYMLYSFYRHITRPLQQLMEAQSKVKQGELGYQVEQIPDSMEIRAITQGFNAMSLSMKQQFQQSYQEQVALQDAQMKTLQSQINPHFLNNTLEIINWETRIAGNDTASAMIESLSVMLRATMDREGKGKITLRQELTYVDAYLYIQSCRMGARLRIERDIPEETLDMLVPRLVFQPVVENACEHGIKGQKKGVIVVSSALDSHSLRLEVKNSGTLSQENHQRIQTLLDWDEQAGCYVTDAENLGVRNVNQRVKMMYGVAYGLRLENQQDMTVASLSLPREQG